MTPERPQHVNPGPDATWDPVFVPDTYREKPGKKEEKMEESIIELKCWPISFQAIKSGKKRFEYRKNDRPYAVGKTLHQREYEPCYDEENDCLVSGGGYTGGELYHDIEWMIEGGVFGIPLGYCILSMSEPRAAPIPQPESDCSQCRYKLAPDYRELFIRDLLYNFEWTARNGNPEFFKAVSIIKREYLKPDSQLLEAHDARVRNEVLDEAINALKSDSCPDSKQRDCCDSYENCEICILESLRSEVSKE